MADFSDVFAQVAQAVRKVKSDQALKKKLAEEALESVQRRTKLGRGVNKPEGPSNKLPTLKTKTVSTRKSLKRSGKLSSSATPTKSNITRSGKTLGSMKSKIKSDGFDINLDKRGERVAKDLIAIDKDYTFMNLSKAEVKRLVKIIEQQIQQFVGKIK